MRWGSTAGFDSTGRLPATAMQTAYFAGRDPNLPLGGFDCAAYLEFSGRAVEVGRLDAAVVALVGNPFLRLRFADAETLEEVDPQPPQLCVHDLRDWDDDSVSSALAGTRRRMLAAPLDLTAGRTWSVEVSVLPDGTSTVHLAISLAIADIAAIGALASQLASALPEGALPEYQELDAVREQLRRAERPRPVVTQEVVDARPTEVFAPPQLPRPAAVESLDDAADSEPHPLVERFTTWFDNADWERLEERARDLDRTTAALVLALYERALRRFSSSAEFLVTVTGVDTTGTEGEIVDRTVTYAHRARPDVADTFAETVREVGDELRYRISRGVEATTELRDALKAGGGHPGLSPYVFTFAAKRPIFDDDAVAALGEPEFYSTTPQVAIDCRVFRLTSTGVEIAFDARRDALPDGMARDIYDLFVQSLREVIEHGEPRMELARRTIDEREAVNSILPVRETGLLNEEFRKRVQERPHAEAIRWDPSQYRDSGDPIGAQECGRLTYAELEERALRLAASINARVAPGSIVAIRLPKGPSQITAVLGALYAGCTYLPIGTDLPESRAEAVVTAAQAGLVLTADDVATECEPLAEPVTVESGDLAYIIYTSGSTGAPKGVAISHVSALNTVLDVNARNSVGRDDRVLAVSALDFDLSVYDIFGPLSCGASIVTIPEQARRDAFVWGELVRHFGVTVWNTVPGLVEMLLAANDELPSLRVVMCSGDWIDLELFGRLRAAAPKAALVAMGGATEASIWSNEYAIRSEDDIAAWWQSIPYGLPLSGQKYRVVDDSGRDCPNGVAGELWIGGIGVAAGYHRAPELTAERFITDEHGHRWYRTGDLGVWRDGPLLFLLGRLDAQVKVRGHRIECGEVEHALRGVDGISAVVVTPIRNRTALGAVIVPDGAVPVPEDPELLREQVAPVVPHYMVPTVIVQAPELRFTANGKVDRNWAAAQLESTGPSEQSSDVDGVVAGQWRRVLGIERLDPDDNFFVLGGDSLAATQVCAGLRKQGVGAGVDQLFANPTLRAFAAVCADAPAPASITQASEPPPVAGEYPLTPLQRAYALGADGISGVVRTTPRYSAVIRSAETIDFHAWSKAITVVCQSFEGLRCLRHGAAEQRVVPYTEHEPIVWLASGVEAATRLRSHLADLDEDGDPSTVLTAVAVPGHDHEIGLSLNYLGLDARSLMVVLNRVIAEATGTEPSEPIEPSLQMFRHYAEHVTGEEGSRGDTVADLRPPQLPVRRIPSEPVVVRSWELRLDDAESDALTRVAREQQVTVTSLLLAEFGQEVAASLGSDPVDISVPLSRRPSDSASEVLGNFTELALCRCGPGIDAQEVHHALGQAVAGQAPGERDIARAGRAAFPVVFTSTLGLPSAQRLFCGDVKAVWSHTRTPGVLIDCQVVPCANGIELRWDHPEGVFEPGFLERAFAAFTERIRRLTGDPAPPQGGDLAATLRHSAHSVDVERVRPALTPVFERWHVDFADAAGEPDIADAEFLARCVTGEERVTRLLEHDRLAPEAVLRDALESSGLLDEVCDRLRRAADTEGRRLRVAELGAGTGVIHEALVDRLARTEIEWVPIETSPLLRDLGGVRGLDSRWSPPDTPVDVVLAVGSLHRDARLAEMLPDIPVRRPAELMLVEVSEPDAASLVAALLEPRIADPATTPLWTVPTWWNWLVDRNWHPVAVSAPTRHLALVHARHGDRCTTAVTTRTATRTEPAVDVHESREEIRREDVEALLAELWQEHLPESVPRVGSADDFFVLGGDSLAATRVLVGLHNRGFTAVRLVDLFNIPVLGELARHIAGTPQVETPEPAATVTTQTRTFPLTKVQQAYLVGRGEHQLLGGVASHCYFEFEAPELNVERFTAAVRTVVRRHPALRTTVVDDGVPAGRVADEPVHLPVEVVDDPRRCTAAENPDPASRGPLAVRVGRSAGSPIAIGMDNLMLDGSSMWRVLREIGDVYNGATELEPVRASFADYVSARPWLSTEAPAEADAAYWANNPVPEAPALVSPEQILALTERPVFDRVGTSLDRAEWEVVRAAAAEAGITPPALIFAAYAAELAAWTGQERFAINVTTFDRDLTVPGIDAVVGDFTSLTLVSANAADDLVDVGRSAQVQLAAGRDHATVSAIDLQRRAVQTTGDPVRGMYPVVFTCGLGMQDSSLRSDDFGFGRMVASGSQTPQTVLDLQVHDDCRGLHITADHVTQLVDADHVESVVAGIARRLRDIAQPAPTNTAPTVRLAWERYLETELPRSGANFFRAGGDSLRATRCVRFLQDQLDPRITLRMLLAHPDLGAFTAVMEELVTRPQNDSAGEADDDYEAGEL